MTVSYDSLFKVIVVGDAAVGKTSLLHRLKTNRYAEEHASTIGVVNSRFEMMLEESSHVKLQLWDTAGQENFRSITRLFYKDSDAIIVCFSLASRQSFENLTEWIDEIDRYTDTANMVKYLVGNCADAKDNTNVSEEVYSSESEEGTHGRGNVTRDEALKFMKEHGFSHYMETSAKTGENVELLFPTIVRIIM